MRSIKRLGVVAAMAALGLGGVAASIAWAAQSSPAPIAATTWGLDFTVECDGIDGVVIWTLLDHDPAAEFEADLRRIEGVHRDQLVQQRDSLGHDANEARALSIAFAWDRQLRHVTGDRVWLHEVGGEKPGTLTSNGHEGRRWLVTRVAHRDGDPTDPVCWAIPFDATPGETARLVLNEANAVDVAGVYARVLGR
ncbi:MAG: hypothetical protein AAF805_12035 [Planctomycetota bacterium]